MIDPLTAGPARDVETEAKVIGSLFLLLPQDREFFLSQLTPDDFHDPLFRWLYSGLRIWGAVFDGVTLYERLAQHPGKPTGESLAAAVALTIYCRDGSSRLNIALLPCYLSQLKDISSKRARYDAGIQAIIENCHPDHGDWLADRTAIS